MTFDQLVTEVPASAGFDARRPTFDELVEIRIVDPTCDPSWDRLASSHPGCTFFHGAAWMRVLCNTYGHKPLAFCCSRRGQPRALLPLVEVASRFTGTRGVSLPFTDFCAPLFFRDCDPNIIVVNLCAFAQIRGWKHFEIRGRLPTNLPPRSALTFHGHSLDLRGGAEASFVKFASPVKRAIRKAEQSGLSVRLSTSEAAMRDFYRLHARTRRRHGLPPQPFSFFSNIHSEVIKPGLGFVVLAENASKAVAGAVFFYTATTAVFKFAASDERYSHLRPNNLVMWQAIQELSRRDIGTLHLGRTSRGDEGLRRFKLGWGAVEEPINYFRFDVRANRWTTTTDKASGTHNAIFSRLPLAINRLIGAVIYPHLD
jgi:CelD/BcsL family acetyltransferase involved in cellulose biosynthesis